MSFLFSSSGSQVQRFSGMNVQTSVRGIAIARAWGKLRVTGNLIGYWDFTASEQSAGGKGGGMGGATGYSYSVSVQFGLLDNPISSITYAWAGKEQTANPASAFEWSPGTLAQSAWGYLTTNHAADALAYPGLAWVARAHGNLGSSPNLPNLSFEVVTGSAGTCGAYDASAYLICQDILNAVAFPAARIGSTYVMSQWVGAYGIGLSPLMDSQQPAARQIESVTDAAHVAVFFSEGVLKWVPWGDTAKTANGCIFTPSVAPVYDLTDNDFLAVEGKMPIHGTRRGNGDAKNIIRVAYKDRSNAYADAVFAAQDDAHINQFGPRPGETLQYDAIKSATVASTVGYLKLQRSLFVLNTYEFKLPFRFCRLEPMDVVTLTHSLMGLSAVPVRIVKTVDSEDGNIVVTAEDFPAGAGLAPLVGREPPTGYSVDANVAPGNAVAPVIVEPPRLLAGEPALWIATSGGAHFGGADVWVSLDGVSYSRAGTISGKCRFGVLGSALPAVADPDTTSTPAVDLSASGGALMSVSASDRDQYSTLCAVGSGAAAEWISYQTATLTSASHYTLSSLRRGAYGSPVAAWAAGTPFLRADGSVCRVPIDPAMIGRTLYIKLQAFNEYGGAYQDLSTLAATAYTVQGCPPAALGGLVVSAAADGTRVATWPTSAAQVADTVVEVRYSAASGTAWAAMAVLGQVTYGAARLESVLASAAGSWTFEARTRDASGLYATSGPRATVTLPDAPVAVGPGVNLLTNTEFVGTLAPAAQTWNPGGCTALAVDSGKSWIPPGARMLNIDQGVRTGNAWNVGSDVSLAGGFGAGATVPIPVTAGRRYELSARAAVSYCDAELHIVFYDSSNTSLLDATSGALARAAGGAALSSWTQGVVFAAAPAGAVYAVPYWRRTETDAGQTHSYSWLLQPYFGEALTAQTAPSPYAPGAARDTAALTDGANLGKTALWPSVTGTARPLDNAGQVIDLGSGAGAGQRNANDPASFYPVGTVQQFKWSAALGLSVSEWGVLRTERPDGADASVITQTWKSSTGEWKRTGTVAGGWASWSRRVDRPIDSTNVAAFVTNQALDAPQLKDGSATTQYQQVAGLLSVTTSFATANALAFALEVARQVEIDFTALVQHQASGGSLWVQVQSSPDGFATYTDIVPATELLRTPVPAPSAAVIVPVSYTINASMPAGASVSVRVNVQGPGLTSGLLLSSLLKVNVIRK